MQTMGTPTPTPGGGADAAVGGNVNSVPRWKIPRGNGMRLQRADHRKLQVRPGQESRTPVQGPRRSFQPPPAEGRLAFNSGSGGCARPPGAHSPGAPREASFPWVPPKFTLREPSASDEGLEKDLNA